MYVALHKKAVLFVYLLLMKSDSLEWRVHWKRCAGKHMEQGNTRGSAFGAIISLILVCFPIAILWIYMDKLLILIGQDPLISIEARKFSVWLIPSLFPYALLQLITRYLASQSLIFPMLWSSIVVLVIHVPICWALVFKLGFGAAGAALAIGISYTINVIFLVIYLYNSKSCEKTRVTCSGDVYSSIKEFFRFAIPSAVMIW